MNANCAEQPPAAVPTPQVFDAPAGQISTFTRFFQEGCHFGGAVDIDNDILVAGAPCWGRPPGEGAGTAHVFRRSSEGELRMEAALMASDRDDGFQYDQHFGESVALKGTVIAVGAPGYDDPQAGDNTGAVYIFEYDGHAWVETGKLTSQRDEQAVIQSLRRTGIVTLYERAGDQWKQTFQTDPQEASLYAMYGEDAPFGIPVSLGGEAGAGKASWLAVGKQWSQLSPIPPMFSSARAWIGSTASGSFQVLKMAIPMISSAGQSP